MNELLYAFPVFPVLQEVEISAYSYNASLNIHFVNSSYKFVII